MNTPTSETDAAFAAGEFDTQERSMAFTRKLERERDEARSRQPGYDMAFHQLYHCGVSTPGEIEKHNYKLKDLVCILVSQRDELKADLLQANKLLNEQAQHIIKYRPSP